MGFLPMSEEVLTPDTREKWEAIFRNDTGTSRGRSSGQRDWKGRSLLEFPPSYVALDIETTGLDTRLNEIIEVSGVKFENDREVERFQTLVNPGCEIDEFIEDLTGITNDMVRDAPPLEAALPSFLGFLGETVIVGHNVNFDINFLYDKALSLGLPPVSNDFVDTMRMSRRLYPDMPNHKLTTLIQYLGVGDTVEHRALSDALQAQRCYVHMKRYADEIGGIPKPVRKKSKWANRVSSRDIVAQANEFNEDSPIYGRTFVFTGTLERLSRRDAMQAVVNAGGMCKDGVSRKVNYLVLGNNDYNAAIKGGKSTKQRKAESLQLAGVDIAVISENVFYDMLSEGKSDDSTSAPAM